jgi:hypothetical protein
MTPTIKYKNIENFGVKTIYYGHTTAEFQAMETCLKNGLTEFAIENNYIEVNVIDIDYSVDGFLIVSYSYIEK